MRRKREALLLGELARRTSSISLQNNSGRSLLATVIGHSDQTIAAGSGAEVLRVGPDTYDGEADEGADGKQVCHVASYAPNAGPTWACSAGTCLFFAGVTCRLLICAATDRKRRDALVSLDLPRHASLLRQKMRVHLGGHGLDGATAGG